MSKIETILNPQINILKLNAPVDGSFSDDNNDKYDFLRFNDGIDQAKDFGLKSFIVIINGLTLDDNMIDYLIIDSTGKYPTITMRIDPNQDEFFNFALPKDGDLISVYYRSTIKDLKPLRNDFIITDCYIEQTNESWILHGVIHIKNMFYDTSFSYDGTSLKTAIEVAKKLKLGFATNVESTDDEQKWVCASEPLDTFLGTLKKHSWKNEKSFFDMYIDNYYMLNFVNVRDQLTNEKKKKISPGIYKIRDFIQTNNKSYIQPKDDTFEYTDPVIFTNWYQSLIDENYISQIRILNTSSRISLEEGYKKYLHFYDHSLDEKVELNNELIVSDSDMSDYSVLIGGYTDTDWKKNSRHLWKGISYSLPDHNVHPFYYKAEFHNEQNLKEIDKLTIEVTLPQVNFNLYRYMIVPVVYYDHGPKSDLLRDAGLKLNDRSKDTSLVNRTYILNDFISGFYVIKGFVINYMGAKDGGPNYIDQKVILTRTEWPKNVIITDETKSIVTNHNK